MGKDLDYRDMDYYEGEGPKVVVRDFDYIPGKPKKEEVKEEEKKEEKKPVKKVGRPKK